MTTLHKNLIGNFIVDKKEIIDFTNFSSLNDYENSEKEEKKLIKKYKAKLASKEQKKELLPLLNNQKYFQVFRSQNLLLTKQQIKHSVNEDDLVVQTVNNMNELDTTANTLVKRLREWFSLFLPELDKDVYNHEKFAELVATKTKAQLVKELKVNTKESMGADIKKVDLTQIKLLAEQIINLYKLRDEHEIYLEKIMLKYCPNFHAVAGTNIGAKLFEHGRSLKRLACLPASTIQLLGAEKALFRHIKTGSKSPKYGILYTHYLVQKAKRKDRGTVARSLANNLTIALRIDYFKGEFIGDKIRENLERKFGYKRDEKDFNSEDN